MATSDGPINPPEPNCCNESDDCTKGEGCVCDDHRCNSCDDCRCQCDEEPW